MHGIGAGNLLVEVQENSNITYRMYDYNRVDDSGKKRELHINKALHILKYAMIPILTISKDAHQEINCKN